MMKRISCCLMVCLMLLCNAVSVFAEEQPILTITAEEAAQMAEEYVALNCTEDQIGGIVDFLEAVNTLDELTAGSSLVVQATVLKGSKNYKTPQTVGKVVTPIQINKIYKSDDKLSSLKVGDIILISEPYCFIDNNDGTFTKSMDEGYDVSEVGKEYVFFLKYNEKGYKNVPQDKNVYFMVHRLTLGRYPVVDVNSRSVLNVRSMTKEDFDISPVLNYREDGYTMTTYKNIFQEIVRTLK